MDTPKSKLSMYNKNNPIIAVKKRVSLLVENIRAVGRLVKFLESEDSYTWWNKVSK